MNWGSKAWDNNDRKPFDHADFMIIDSHQHFWHYQPYRDSWITEDMSAIRRDFLPDDLAAHLKAHKINGCVAVQADQSEKETGFLIKCAQANSFIKGVVGWTDFRSPGLQARLEYYYQFSEVKGFRHIVQAEPEDFLLQKQFCNGISLLQQYDFTYDILVHPWQLPAVLKFVKMFPNQNFVIDHMAKPLIKDQKIKPWKQLLMEIAMHEHVFCKVSGLVTEADWKKWKVSDFTPYLETALEAFGPTRLMYGSDWPVCLLAADYEQQWLIIQPFTDRLTPTEKKAILGENARRFYHL